MEPGEKVTWLRNAVTPCQSRKLFTNQELFLLPSLNAECGNATIVHIFTKIICLFYCLLSKHLLVNPLLMFGFILLSRQSSKITL